jgi:dienelactone hydrolase
MSEIRIPSANHRLAARCSNQRARRREGVDRDRIGVCGASYGGHLACLLLGSRQVKRLLLRAPAQPSEDALRNLRAFERSTLILESGADEVVRQAIIDK